MPLSYERLGSDACLWLSIPLESRGEVVLCFRDAAAAARYAHICPWQRMEGPVQIVPYAAGQVKTWMFEMRFPQVVQTWKDHFACCCHRTEWPANPWIKREMTQTGYCEETLRFQSKGAGSGCETDADQEAWSAVCEFPWPTDFPSWPLGLKAKVCPLQTWRGETRYIRCELSETIWLQAEV
jgi:hypothetical protein